MNSINIIIICPTLTKIFMQRNIMEDHCSLFEPYFRIPPCQIYHFQRLLWLSKIGSSVVELKPTCKVEYKHIEACTILISFQ